MKNEIKVGEWVKLDNGNIGQVIAVEKGSIMLNIVQNRWVGMCCIKKHNFNIIKLIECGDYVNGYKVCEIDKYRIGFEGCRRSKSYYYFEDFEDNDFEIKSIVTKEQFKSIEYTVKEK